MRFIAAREIGFAGTLELGPKALRHLTHIYAPSIARFSTLNGGHVIVAHQDVEEDGVDCNTKYYLVVQAIIAKKLGSALTPTQP